MRYSGEYWDTETGLQYLRARWYDPNIGRFINENTYEGEKDKPGTLNLYAYVENRSLIYSDLSGHLTFKAAWYISRGSQNYLIGSIFGGVKSIFTPSTYQAIWEMSQAIYHGELSLKELAGYVGGEIASPFNYLATHGNHVLNGDPTKDEAYAYGLQYGRALATLESAFTAGALLTPKIAGVLKKSGGFLSSFKSLKAKTSDLVKNPKDEFNYYGGNYNSTASKNAREYIHKHGTIEKPIDVKILDNGTMQIIDGHHRWWAAKQTGLDTVPIKVVK